jgi:hypothetical protein
MERTENAEGNRGILRVLCALHGYLPYNLVDESPAEIGQSFISAVV